MKVQEPDGLTESLTGVQPIIDLKLFSQGPVKFNVNYNIHGSYNGENLLIKTSKTNKKFYINLCTIV